MHHYLQFYHMLDFWEMSGLLMAMMMCDKFIISCVAPPVDSLDLHPLPLAWQWRPLAPVQEVSHRQQRGLYPVLLYKETLNIVHR